MNAFAEMKKMQKKISDLEFIAQKKISDLELLMKKCGDMSNRSVMIRSCIRICIRSCIWSVGRSVGDMYNFFELLDKMVRVLVATHFDEKENADVGLIAQKKKVDLELVMAAARGVVMSLMQLKVLTQVAKLHGSLDAYNSAGPADLTADKDQSYTRQRKARNQRLPLQRL